MHSPIERTENLLITVAGVRSVLELFPGLNLAILFGSIALGFPNPMQLR